MTATYTSDIFSGLDGNASHGPPGDWGGYWGKQGPEFLDHRRAAYDGEQRMVFGASTFGQFAHMLPAIDPDQRDSWIDRMLSCPSCWKPAPSTAAPRSWSTGLPFEPGRPADRTGRST